MKTSNKIMAALLAVSLLSPVPAWAAKSGEGHHPAKEQMKFEQSLLHKTKMEKTSEKWKLPQLDKLEAKWKDAKKKSISAKEMPDEMEEMLKKAYDILPELKELKVTEAEIILESEDNPELWSFWFDGTDKNDKKNRSWAYLTLEPKDGIIVEYRMSNSKWESPKAPTEKAAKDKATAFLKKVLKDFAPIYKITEVYRDEDSKDEDDEEYDKLAYVHFSRTVHDVPYEGVGADIIIDGEGRILHYNADLEGISLDESVFPDPSDAIQQKDAKAAYSKLEEMTLAYRKEQPVEYDRKKDEYKTKPVLKYVPTYEGPMDAVTGDEFDIINNVRPESDMIQLKPEGTVLTASSRQEAEALLKDLFHLDVTGWNFNQYPDENDEGEDEKKSDFIHYNWYTYDDQRDEEVYMTINKETHQVTSYSHEVFNYDDEESDNPSDLISKNEAKKIAIENLQKFVKKEMTEGQLNLLYAPIEEADLPDWVDKDELPGYWKRNMYFYSLNELYQGVPIEDSQYAIAINAETGEITDLYFNDSDDEIKLPDNKNTATPEKAEDAYLNNMSFQMIYIWPDYYGQKAPKPALLYVAGPRYDGYIDAFTGKLVRFKLR